MDLRTIWNLAFVALLAACGGDDFAGDDSFNHINTDGNNANNSQNSQNGGLDMSDEADMPVDEPDMSPTTCEPACGPGETCDPGGQCVEACMPACEAPEVCTETGCRVPDSPEHPAEGPEAGSSPEARPPGPSLLLAAVLSLAAAGGGAWLGAPLLVPRATEAVASMRAGSDTDESVGESGENTVEHEMSNIVLNPAGSGGMRFLVASVALEVTEPALAELEARDSEARDLVSTLLATRTVEILSDVGMRDALRDALREALNAMLGFDGVVRIFFPQFVIQ